MWRSLSFHRQRGEQFGDGAVKQGVAQVGGKFGQRFENEAPLVQAGMGQLKLRVRRHLIIHQQQIQVDEARPPALGADAAELRLDAQQEFQELVGGPAWFPLRRRR